MNYCSIDKDSPEYTSLVDGLRTAGLEPAEAAWQADKDILEYDGIVRNANQVAAKLAAQPFSLIKQLNYPANPNVALPLEGNEDLYKKYKLVNKEGKIQVVKKGEATTKILASLNRSPYYSFQLRETTGGTKILIFPGALNTIQNENIRTTPKPIDISGGVGVLWGRLSITEHNMAFSRVEGLASKFPISNSLQSRVVGQTFNEVWDSGSFNSLERGHILLNSIQKRLSDRNTFNGKLFAKIEKKWGSVDIRVDDQLIFPMFVKDGHIYINPFSLADNIKGIEDSNHYVDMALSEELIHLVSEHFLSQKEKDEIFEKEINGQQLAKAIGGIYQSLELSNKNLALYEYIRMLIQQEFLGTTTEQVKYTKGGIIDKFIQEIWDFLQDFFTKNNQSTFGKVVKKHSDFIREDASYYRPSATEVMMEVLGVDTQDLSKLTTSNNRSREIASKLSNQLGIDYAVINEQEAVQLDKNWKGEPALFIGGKVYFVGEKLTSTMAFHEFGHPLIRSISVRNPELFSKLFTELSQSQEGREILERVRTDYPELPEDSDLFKEEALVFSLQYAAQRSEDKIQSSTPFEKFLNNFLYSIKRLLREIFGNKVDVSKLDQNTTIDRLSEMLAKGNNFDINIEDVSQEDVASYLRDSEAQVQELLKVDDKHILDLVNSAFDKVSKHINEIKNSKNYDAAVDIFANEFSSGELDSIRKSLKDNQTRILEVLDNKLTEAEQVRERVNALVKTLGHLNNLTRKIKDQMNVIGKDIDDQDNLQRAAFLESTLDYWKNFIQEADDAIPDKTSPVYEVLQSIKANMATTDTIFTSIQERAATDALTATLQSTMDNMEAAYQEERESLLKKNAPKKFIDELDVKYELVKLTPEKIKQALKGKLGDINMVGAFMEGYTYNPDPVVGGLAKYVKDAMTEVEAKIYTNYNNFINSIQEDLKAVNYSPGSEGKLGEDLGFKDQVGVVNDKGEFETKEVWRFLNEFKGHDLVSDEFRFKIKQAGDKYAESQTDADKKVLYDLEAAWRQHKIEFFHQKYTPEFYKTYELFEKDEVGKEAGMLQDTIQRKIQAAYNSPTNSKTALEVLDEVAEYKRELKRLADLRDGAGRMKTGKELAIAERLQQFREESKQFYTSVEIPGAFQSALREYESQLAEEGIEAGGERWMLLRNAWLEKNTVKTLKPEFWERRKQITDDIKTILAAVPQDIQSQLNVEEANEKLKEVMFGYKDEAGQPVGSEMTPERLAVVKDSQEKLIAAREKLRSLTGLTIEDRDELTELYNRASSSGLTDDMQTRLIELLSKQSALGLGRLARGQLITLYEELENLQSTIPTDDYIDTVNNWLSSLDKEGIWTEYKLTAIDKDSESIIRSDRVLQPLFDQSPEFKDWFEANHIRVKKKDRLTYEEKMVWERIYAWNTIEPKSEEYYNTTELTDQSGKVTETIVGKPAGKFFKSLVKDEYLTKKVIGQTIDNGGRWLPKTVNRGAKDGRYRNEDYYRLAVDNPKMHTLLEKMKSAHIKFQEGAERNGKLWYDMPRYRKDTIEKIQSKNPFSRLVDGIKLFWQKRKDAVESGFNAKDDYNLVKLDMFNTKSSGIPVSGLANLDVDEVSTDIAYTMMRYMASITRQAKLAEISPTVRAIQATVNNQKNFPIVEKAFKNRVLSFWDDKKKKYTRAQAVNNYIERNLEGIENTGLFGENAVAQNASRFLFGKASFAFLALNIPSAIKNAMGMKFQGMVEAASGKYLTPLELIKAEGWATNAVMTNSFEVYKKGTKSLNVQLIDIFDFETGKTMSDLGKSLTRTVGKDSAKVIERLSDFRKWTQLQGAVQTGVAMMMHQKVQQGDKWIDYLDAWELNKDGKIQLKEGVDPAWGLTYDKEGNAVVGKKFIAKKAEMQRVLELMNGAMSKESAPEAQRYLLYRYISFMRRWFTGQLMNRFAFSGNLLKGTSTGRVDYMLGASKEGTYITFLKTFTNTVKNVGRNLQYMSPTEKEASLRFIAEVGSLLLLSAIAFLIFGHDGDDEDRFKKLAARSGPLPMFASENAPEFHAGGFVANHALLMVLSIKGENEQFLPFPNAGANDYMQLLDLKSLALSPTIKTYYDIAKDLGNHLTGDQDAYFKRDSGNMFWKEAGDKKIWAHALKTTGITGSTADPVTTLKNFEAIQRK